ncbi:hypothetical protein Lal_00008051 [Lupinus albus]|nr:hypothetical protein Lal_00008051 [Lupinus albus]
MPSILVQRVAFATGVLPNIYEFHLYTRNSTRLSKILAPSFKGSSGVEPRAFTSDLSNRLRTVIIIPGKRALRPEAFITHAALLDQACAHCPIFPTAASRRSLGRVSVPVWLIILSDQLRIVGLQRADSHALRTRAPLTPKGSFDLHVLGMPPAFVLSQDQTLKLCHNTIQTAKAQSRQHRTSGADTCTVKRNGYEGHIRHRLLPRPEPEAPSRAPSPTCPFI